ncbi:histidine kinase dimerization/phospho-acceptor domain-containing protein [Natrononativus amylolyticus]|uniref:histidine kinase dimerization/phospho-acceptor domain-containing protein n=1 Tax=Natrononativus amylolyticus TaxID=2963434 RepID=UPI0020CF2F1A|nr:histidine kinase dimerization/phospho-acceptor domain-containing protein [Natrononativus amylolyticus]
MTDLPDDSETDDDRSRLESLLRVARRVLESPTETALYDVVLAGLPDLFDVRDAAITIRRDDHTVTIRGEDSDRSKSGAGSIPVDRRERVIERGGTVVVDGPNDGYKPPDGSQTLCTPFGDSGLLQLTADDGFDDEDVRYAELLGEVVSAQLARPIAAGAVAAGDCDAFSEFQRGVLELASHELRTPLTTVLGYTEMLVDEELGALSPDQRAAVQLVLRKATELDATLETLTSAVDGRPIRGGSTLESTDDRSNVLGVVDRPVVLLGLEAEFANYLTEQLQNVGYAVTIVDDLTAAREAMSADPSSVLVVDAFAANVPLDVVWHENTRPGTKIAVLSIVREEATGVPLLGVSAYLAENELALATTVETLLGADGQGSVRALLFDATAVDEPVEGVPDSWDVTTVTDLESVPDLSDGYNIAIVRTDGFDASDTEKRVVRALRERRDGRRLPVVLVDRSGSQREPQFTVGGTLFVQRPLTVSDIVSALIATSVTSTAKSCDDRTRPGTLNK